MSVTVVGAGLAGWRLCQYLRRDGYRGALWLVGEEPEPPYERPPLSKQVLAGSWPLERTSLAGEEEFAAAGVTYLAGVLATSLEADSRTVELADGRRIEAETVVIATGTRARRLPWSGDGRVHYLRSRADLRSLESELAPLDPGTRVLVIGAGFIGAEVATALKSRGLEPLVLEAAPRPLVGPLGETVAAWLEPLAARHGVELRTATPVQDVREEGEELVVVAGSQELRSAVVIAGAGASPNVEWLAGSGLALDDGVLVDRDLWAAPGVAAMGDVARFLWMGPAGEERVRIEHWQVANDHAAALSRHLCGLEPAAPMVPYFWSDQYGRKIQVLGHPHRDDEVELVLGDPEDGAFLALYHREGVVTGLVALSQPRALMLSRTLLEQSTPVEQARARAPWAR